MDSTNKPTPVEAAVEMYRAALATYQQAAELFLRVVAHKQVRRGQSATVPYSGATDFKTLEQRAVDAERDWSYALDKARVAMLATLYAAQPAQPAQLAAEFTVAIAKTCG